MNEEEKRKYEAFQYWIQTNTERGVTTIPDNLCLFVINLIKSLQKENKELKEYISIAPNLDEMTAVKYRNIREDAYIQGRAEEKQRAEQIIYENYIPTQKVKDKIEELNRKIDKSIDNSKGGLDEEFIEKAGELLTQKRILQELLEKTEK